jgi:hypothetical protein
VEEKMQIQHTNLLGWFGITLATMLVISACEPSQPSQPSPDREATPAYDPKGSEAVANKVRKDIWNTYDSTLDFISTSGIVWLDSCLELGEEDEACDEVETPGYFIEAGKSTRTWVYHANADGSEIRGYESDHQSLLQGRTVSVTVISEYREVIQVHSGPGFDYPVVGELERGSVVEAIGITVNGGWLQIVMPGLGENELAWLYIPLTDYSDDDELPVVDPPPTPTPD